ncbi:g11218 [Coccomyxa viridis]|uniref:G11218 protein n=1 Tax=Coccomyxa viridis TaxID=1274662 RepID=A0ABP1G7L8_9CHLO
MGIIYSRAILPLTTARATTTSSQTRADPRAKHFWTKDEVPPLDGKVFLVTGSSSGMGWYCAKTLAENGGHVIMAARSLERTQKAAQMIKDSGVRGKVEAMHLDLSSFRSIKEFSDQMHKREEKLDVLVNNAGVFLVEHNRTEEGFEVVQGTNYFGTFLLTHLLLDKLKDTAQNKGHARHVPSHSVSHPTWIVTMASLFELLGWIQWDDLEGQKSRESGVFEYSTSKLELIMMMRHLNKNLQGTGIDCLISQPGLVKTPLNGRKLDHRKLSAIGVDLATKVYGQEASQAANCLIRPATDPTVEGYGGSYFSPPWLWLLALNFDHAAMREPGNSYARDEAAWERLYQKTLDIVNKRLIERGLPQIEAVSASMPARA